MTILPLKFITGMDMPTLTRNAGRGLPAGVSEVTVVAMVEGSRRGARPRSVTPAGRDAVVTATRTST
jgi:hypothetical protein